MTSVNFWTDKPLDKQQQSTNVTEVVQAAPVISVPIGQSDSKPVKPVSENELTATLAGSAENRTHDFNNNLTKVDTGDIESKNVPPTFASGLKAIFGADNTVSKEDMQTAYNYVSEHNYKIDDEDADFKALPKGAQAYIKNVAALQIKEHPEVAQKDKEIC